MPDTIAPVSIVALGASNTAGHGVGAALAYPAVIERLLRVRGFNVMVVNAGISGETTGAMLARLDRDVPDGTSLVLFQPGSNDVRKGLGEAVRERNVEIIQGRLRDRGIPVIRVAKAFEAARQGNLQPDSIHYTARGHELIAAYVLEEVVQLLAKRDSSHRSG